MFSFDFLLLSMYFFFIFRCKMDFRWKLLSTELSMNGLCLCVCVCVWRGGGGPAAFYFFQATIHHKCSNKIVFFFLQGQGRGYCIIVTTSVTAAVIFACRGTVATTFAPTVGACVSSGKAYPDQVSTKCDALWHNNELLS